MIFYIIMCICIIIYTIYIIYIYNIEYIYIYRKHIYIYITGLSSASFKLSGNTLLRIVSLKRLHKTWTVASEPAFSIFGEIFLCVVVFFGFRSLIFNSKSLKDTGSDLKLSLLVILILIRKMLGLDSNFAMACWTGSEIFSYSSVIIKEFSVIPIVETAFLKNSFNFLVILCETSSSTSLILALVSLIRK